MSIDRSSYNYNSLITRISRHNGWQPIMLTPIKLSPWMVGRGHGEGTARARNFGPHLAIGLEFQDVSGYCKESWINQLEMGLCENFKTKC